MVLIGLFVALVVLHLGLSWRLDCPVKGDEVVYLGAARGLATGTGLVTADGRHAYKIGYSLLLVPGMLLNDDPIGGFKIAQVTNALLLALLLPLAFLLAGRLDGTLESRDRLLLAVCVSVYPAVLLYGTTAMSANAFLPAFFLVALAAGAAFRCGRPRDWAGLGVATAFVYSVHERALGIVLIGAAAALVAVLRRRHHRWAPLAYLGGLAAAGGLLRWVEVPGSSWKTGHTSMLVFLQAFSDPRTLVATAAGHVWYLGLATFGVLLLGGFALILGRGRTTGERRDFLVPYLWLCGASVVAISVLFNVIRWDVEGFTHWVCGRHSESVLLPVVLVSLIAIRRYGLERRWRLLGGAFVLTGLTLGVLTLVLRALWTPNAGIPHSFSASSTPLYLEMLTIGGRGAAIVVGVGYAALSWMLARRWRWGVVALTVLFGVSTAVTYTTSWRDRYVAMDGQRELVRLIRRLEHGPVVPRRTILYPRELSTFNVHFYNAAYFLPDYRFLPLAKDTAFVEGELVLSGALNPQALSRAPGARLAGLESVPARGWGYIQSLAVLPGPLQDELAARGWLLPLGLPGPLPAGALAATVTAATMPPPTLRPGETTPLQVRVSNRSSCPWPNRRGLGGKEWAVGLVTRWYKVGTDTPEATMWCDFPRVIYPGETQLLAPGLRAGDRVHDTPPGTYHVVVGVAQRPGGQLAAPAPHDLELLVEVTDDDAHVAEDVPTGS